MRLVHRQTPRPNASNRATGVIFAVLLGALCVQGRADESAILRNLRAYFHTTDADARAGLVRRIEHDPDYAPEKLHGWLHGAGLFAPLEVGRHHLAVALEHGRSLPLDVRIPAGYDPRRPWPLIYALHGTGGSADSIIRYLEHVLGERIEQAVVAAPTGYTQVAIRAAAAPSREHLAALLAVKRIVHIDSDRVVAIGYSRGGHACWTLAVLHPDEFAGVVPIAGTLLLPEPDALFDVFLPNVARTHVLVCWGAGDVTGPDLVRQSPQGGIAGLNRRLCRVAAQLQLPVRWYEAPGKAHGGVIPPARELRDLLARRRPPPPRRVRQVFRLPYQGRAAWIEMHRWRGSWWDERPLELRLRPHEDAGDPAVRRRAVARAVRGRLGELRGEIDGQNITVYRKKTSELTIWIPEHAIDWKRPVRVKVNGRRVFDGVLRPDLGVCLAQADRTYDFERLRWAGLRFKSGHRTRPVTATTPFPVPALIPK